MAIYLLSRIEAPDYDEYDAKVVIARTDKHARKLANQLVGDEGYIWEDPAQVECELIDHYGEPCVILESFNAG